MKSINALNVVAIRVCVNKEKMYSVKINFVLPKNGYSLVHDRFPPPFPPVHMYFLPCTAVTVIVSWQTVVWFGSLLAHSRVL